MVSQEIFEVATRGRGALELTQRVREAVARANIRTGIGQLFLHHTSASLMYCENADPDVHRDLEVFMDNLVPDGYPDFIHTMEGPDDMPAHVRSVLTGADLSFPVTDGQVTLGTWQGIYLWEHRRRGHRRRLTLTLYGE